MGLSLALRACTLTSAQDTFPYVRRLTEGGFFRDLASVLEKLRLQHLRQIRAASGATVALIKPLPADQAALSLQAAQTQAVKALAMPEREPVTVAAA
jgi:sensor domain CHASE-containing protein